MASLDRREHQRVLQGKISRQVDQENREAASPQD
jgi:hypothetical protein